MGAQSRRSSLPAPRRTDQLGGTDKQRRPFATASRFNSIQPEQICLAAKVSSPTPLDMRSPTASIRPSPKRKTALHSRPPLERMMRLHERLKAGKFPNCRKLAKEFEVSSKTIQRDIDFMRYRLNLPIEYDQLHFGFAYTEPVTSFPSIEVSEGEIEPSSWPARQWISIKALPSKNPSGQRSKKSARGSTTQSSFIGAASILRSRSGVSERVWLTSSCSKL